MRGNFARTNQRPSLKQRIQARKDYNRRLAAQDAKNRCAQCRVSLVGKQVFRIFGDARQWCSALCVPKVSA